MSFIASSKFIEDCLFQTDCFHGDKGNDPREPPCTVSLYTRPIINSGVKGAKHWLLYFDWGYYSATYEANECEGILTPCSNPGPPKAPKGMKFSTKEVKKGLRISPKVVDEKAKGNKYSGRKYDLIMANCQNWVQELAKMLDFSLPTGQVKEWVDIGATTVTVVGGVAAVAATVSSAVKN